MSRPMINASVKEAVQQGNLSRMKIYLVNIIKFDPCFRTTEFWDSVKYVKNQGINIDEKYQKCIDEFELPPEQWNENYFMRLVEWLRSNFSPETRIAYIEKVGKAIYEPIISKYENETIDKNNLTERREVSRTKKVSSQRRKGLLLLLAGVAVLAIIVLNQIMAK